MVADPRATLRWALASVAVLFGGAWSSVALAHPYHTTSATAELNRDTGSLEVALRVSPEDLEKALGYRTGRRISLDKTKDVDKLIQGYLGEVFKVEAADGKKPELEWVGREFEGTSLWLYFEFPRLGDLDGAKITQRIFLEYFARHINTAVFVDGRKRRTVQFTVEHVTRTFRWTSPRARKPVADERQRASEGEGPSEKKERPKKVG